MVEHAVMYSSRGVCHRHRRQQSRAAAADKNGAETAEGCLIFPVPITTQMWPSGGKADNNTSDFMGDSLSLTPWI